MKVTPSSQSQRPAVSEQTYQVLSEVESGSVVWPPGLEDHYEALATAFLTQWVQPSATR